MANYFLPPYGRPPSGYDPYGQRSGPRQQRPNNGQDNMPYSITPGQYLGKPPPFEGVTGAPSYGRLDCRTTHAQLPTHEAERIRRVLPEPLYHGIQYVLISTEGRYPLRKAFTGARWPEIGHDDIRAAQEAHSERYGENDVNFDPLAAASLEAQYDRRPRKARKEENEFAALTNVIGWSHAILCVVTLDKNSHYASPNFWGWEWELTTTENGEARYNFRDGVRAETTTNFEYQGITKCTPEDVEAKVRIYMEANPEYRLLQNNCRIFAKDIAGQLVRETVVTTPSPSQALDYIPELRSLPARPSRLEPREPTTERRRRNQESFW